MLENSLHVHRSSYSFETELKITGKSELISFGQAMNCAKIAESWLQVLQSKRNTNKVRIRLCVDKEINLCIEDDASDQQLKARGKNLIKSMVYYRVIGMNGSIQFTETEWGTNLLCVSFPLQEK